MARFLKLLSSVFKNLLHKLISCQCVCINSVACDLVFSTYKINRKEKEEEEEGKKKKN
jgi:hypothetical protein